MCGRVVDVVDRRRHVIPRHRASLPTSPPRISADIERPAPTALRYNGARCANGRPVAGASVAIGATRGRTAELQVVDAVEFTFELAPPGAVRGRRTPLRRGAEALAHLVDALGELVPLLAESGEAREDLVARALEQEVVDGLTHHREHREQRAWASTAPPFAKRLSSSAGVVLVDERVDALVGDEQQHVIDGAAGLDVVACRDLLDPARTSRRKALAWPTRSLSVAARDSAGSCRPGT